LDELKLLYIFAGKQKNSKIQRFKIQNFTVLRSYGLTILRFLFMEKKKLKLPVGTQTFETLRTEGYVYVDKTKHLVNMIDTGRIYFLARPRRFGKSMTVSTFDALFSGKKDLFKGLYAEEFLNRPDFRPSPVIRLDMSNISTHMGVEIMEESMQHMTRSAAEKLNIDISDSKTSGDMLGELIEKTADKYDQKVVFLLDEYDKPYTDFANDPEMAEKVRNVLRSYYVKIKAKDDFIRFVFITGISKFAKLGVFSTLNTLQDISLMPEYAEICGYTEEEIIRYFPDYLDEAAKYMHISTSELIEKMRYYYNGFAFDANASVKLYNPFSTLLFLGERFFFNYWIDTGSPKFMADYMKRHKVTVEQFRNLPISLDFARSPGDVDTAPPEGFFYQCGYLTLHPAEGGGLVLDYPNTEVLNSMSKLVAENIFRSKDENDQYFSQIIFKALRENDLKLFKYALSTLLASIPYDDYSKAAEQHVNLKGYQFPAQEWLYRSCILSFLRGCGVVVDAELHTHRGRPDLVISHNGNIWVIEMKVAYAGESATQKAQEAYLQIIDKQYAQPYPNALCIGLGIDNSQRQITAMQTE